jgi:hypothetical protein
MLASQDRELVPQHDEFDVLGELGPSTPNEQPQNSREGKVGEGEEHRPILPGLGTPSRLTVLAPSGGFWYPRAREPYGRVQFFERGFVRLEAVSYKQLKLPTKIEV